LPLWICRQRAGSCGNTWAELAPTRYRGGSCSTGRTQPGVLAKTAGRSIKRTVQPRNSRLDRYSWESPTVGKTRQSRDIRRSSNQWEKAGACREAKACYGKCSRSSRSLYLPAACLFFLRSWSEIKFIEIPSISMTSRLE
jgi:hypothetical protein